MKEPTIIAQIGNKELLQLSKTAFLCSRKIPAAAVLSCYTWAQAQRDAGQCIISGFHSQLEQDVLHFLLKGTQPIIVALARGMYRTIPEKLKAPLDTGRLLIISPFDEKVGRTTSKHASIRNAIMVGLANSIVIGHASAGGAIEKLMAATNKPHTILSQQS